MALLHESGTRPERNRAKLYDQVFELLYEGRHRPVRRPLPNRNAAHRALGHVGYGMTLDNRDAEPVGDLEERLTHEDAQPVRQDLAAEERWREPRAFLDDLAEHTGILGPHDGADADWRFWHRTIREALAAEALERQLKNAQPTRLDGFLGKLGFERPEPWRRTVGDHARRVRGDEGRWAEPYALLAGRVESPDDLVLALAGENRELGLRAVATAQGLRQETLAKILRLSGDWKERRKVYEQIPDLIDDPERALALVDQLRQRADKSRDLFSLARTIVDIGRRWPLVERLAKRLELSLKAELFQWVGTLDGRVELWREIAPGSFRMGSPEEESQWDDERPQHPVTIQARFRMASVPVTNAQYAAFDPDKSDAERPDHPVVNVSWDEAMKFCDWLSSTYPWARGVRLPTEEEWEYACRAGSETAYWNGDDEADLDRVGWYDKNSGDRTHPVGEKPANAWGLYDVHGNVWEWTLSQWTADYSGREKGHAVDPAADHAAAATGGGRRVIRGGGFWDDADYARAAYRNHRFPDSEYDLQGFRLLLPPRPPEPGP